MFLFIYFENWNYLPVLKKRFACQNKSSWTKVKPAVDFMNVFENYDKIIHSMTQRGHAPIRRAHVKRNTAAELIGTRR